MTKFILNFETPVMVLSNSDEDPNWVVDVDGAGMGGGTYDGNACSYSSGNSEPKEKKVPIAFLLAKMSEYVYKPKTKKKTKLEETYSNANWHTKSWYLWPLHEFCEPLLGLTKHYGEQMPSPIKLFLQLWNAKEQRKLVKESNAYCLWKRVLNVGGETRPTHLRRIISANFRKFVGITTFVSIYQQPPIRDYWNAGPGGLGCAEVSSTMSRNCFRHILSNLHIAPKETLVHDRTHLNYNPIGQVR